jgi:hypothetical protein
VSVRRITFSGAFSVKGSGLPARKTFTGAFNVKGTGTPRTLQLDDTFEVLGAAPTIMVWDGFAWFASVQRVWTGTGWYPPLT